SRAKELADNIRDAASDLGEAINALVKEQPELANVEELNPANMPSMDEIGKSTASLQAFRKTLNKNLIRGMKEVLADMNSSYHELKTIAEIYNKNKIATASAENRKLLNELTVDTFAEANKVLAKHKKLLSAFVKYTSATNNVKIRLKKEAAIK